MDGTRNRFDGYPVPHHLKALLGPLKNSTLFPLLQLEIEDVRADVESKDEEARRLQQEIEDARRQLEVLHVQFIIFHSRDIPRYIEMSLMYVSTISNFSENVIKDLKATTPTWAVCCFQNSPKSYQVFGLHLPIL